jgi:hypothetical protein
VVVGRESNVRKTPFYNGQIIESLARHCVGLEICVRQERFFKNKFGQMIREEVLTFELPSIKRKLTLQSPRDVAKNVIDAAKGRVPAESMEDLLCAHEAVGFVEPSPLFDITSVSQQYQTSYHGKELNNAISYSTLGKTE